MNTVNYRKLLLDAADFSGLDPDNVQVSEAGTLQRNLSTSLAKIWQSNRWPDLMGIEQRCYRAEWASGTTYAAGDEVYWPATDNFFQALRASTGQPPADSNDDTNTAYWFECASDYAGEDYAAATAYVAGDIVFYPTTRRSYACHTASTGNAPTDTAFWGVLTPFEQSIALEQAGQTAIGEVFRVSLDDPRIAPYGETYEFFLTADEVQIPFGPSRPWIEFRKRCPDLTGDIYDAAEAYAAGDQMEFTDGELYDCVTATTAGQTPVTNAAKWSKVEIPDGFRAYCAHHASALYLKRDGQWDAFRVEYDLAKDELAGEVDMLVNQQKQNRRPLVAVR